MPTKPRRACTYPGCPGFAVAGGRCAKHRREPWAGRRNFEGYKGEYLRNRAAVLKAQPYCAMCGAQSETAHHIIRPADGGTHGVSNLVALCRACHARISARQAAEGRSGKVNNPLR